MDFMHDQLAPARLKALCDAVKAKRGLAVAVHVREVTRAIFAHARASGQSVKNPAEAIRALSPAEIRTFLTALEQVVATLTLRLALKFVLLTGVRKSEFLDATWAEVDFDAERWLIPAERMKAGKAYGEAVDATVLIPCMLEAYMAGDRGFRRGGGDRSRLSFREAMPLER